MKPWRSAFELPPEREGSPELSPDDAEQDHSSPRAGLLPTETGNAQAVWTSPFDTSMGPPSPETSGRPIERPGTILGTPIQDTRDWDGPQHSPDTCAIRCQEFVIEQFTHTEIDEDILIQEALDHGWYTPGSGTAVTDLGNILELHEIPVRRYQDANIIQLAQELSQGHKIILAVDAAEMWDPVPIVEDLKDWFGFEGANHAIVVTGIDTRDPNELRVIINDPGTGEAGRSYPLDQFVNAWKDSRFAMIATRDPVPRTAPEMRFFDYAAGFFERVSEAIGLCIPRPEERAGMNPDWPGDLQHPGSPGPLDLGLPHLGLGGYGHALPSMDVGPAADDPSHPVSGDHNGGPGHSAHDEVGHFDHDGDFEAD